MAFLLNLGFGASALVFIVLSVGVHCQDVLKCMSCNRASHFTHCEKMVKCDPDLEVCYVEEEIDVGGETVVNAGCREKTHCDAIGCFGDENKRRKRTPNVRDGDIKMNIGDLNRDIVCHHCCDGDFCNMYGCPDSFDVSHLLGSRCFVCEHVLHPELCNTIKNCDAGYSCGVENISLGMEERYNLHCMKTLKCEMLEQIHNNRRVKRNYVQLGADCCDSHLCNGYMPMKEDPPSMQSATYMCPTRSSSTDVTKINTSLSPTIPPNISTADSTTTATTSLSSTARTTAASCGDADPNCDSYGKDVCLGNYVEWGKQHCKKYCGFCDTKDHTHSNTNHSSTVSATESITTETTALTCEDLDPDCDVYGADYLCLGNYGDWAKEHCAKFCGFCGTTSPYVDSAMTTTALICEDLDQDCDVYGVDYICQGTYEEWAKEHCAKTCGYCGPTTIGTTQAELPCSDLDNDCAEYGFDYICTGDYIPWSSIHCKKFCGFCPVDPSCVDVDTDCAEYGFDYICKGDYLPWSNIHCAKFCKLCTDPATTSVQTTTKPATIPILNTTQQTATQGSKPSTTQGACVDLDTDCDEYGFDYICYGDYIPWSEIHCKKYCDLCPDPPVDPSSPCVDLDTDCAEYGFDYICKGEYLPWSKVHCANFCNLCTGSVTVTTVVTTPHCVDLDSDCGDYGNDYICNGDYIPWSQIHCNKTCNFCHDTCVDEDSDCAEYGSDYICNGVYIPWSKIHCAKFCNFCQEVTSPPPTTTELTSSKLSTTLKSTSKTTILTTTMKLTTEAPSTTMKATSTEAPTTSMKLTTEEPSTTLKLSTEVPLTTMKHTTEAPSTTMKLSTEVPITTINLITEKPTTTLKLSTEVPITTMKLPTEEITTFMKQSTATSTTHMKPTKQTTIDTLTTTMKSKSTNPPRFTLKPTTKIAPTTTIKPTKQTTSAGPETTMKPTKQTPTAGSETTMKPSKQTPTAGSESTIKPTKQTTTAKPTTEEPSTSIKPTTQETSTTMIPATEELSTTMKTTTATEATTLPPSEACEDKIPDCVAYGMDACADQDQKEWMWDNCRGHCKMCLQSRPCTDEMTGCADFKDFVCNDPSQAVSCKETCGICGTT